MVWALIRGLDGCCDAGSGFTYSSGGRELVWVSPARCVWGVVVLLAAVCAVLDEAGGRASRKSDCRMMESGTGPDPESRTESAGGAPVGWRNERDRGFIREQCSLCCVYLVVRSTADSGCWARCSAGTSS